MYKFRLNYKYMYVMYGKKLVYILLYLKSAIERNVALYKNINFYKIQCFKSDLWDITRDCIIYSYIYFWYVRCLGGGEPARVPLPGALQLQPRGRPLHPLPRARHLLPARGHPPRHQQGWSALVAGLQVPYNDFGIFFFYIIKAKYTMSYGN